MNGAMRSSSLTMRKRRRPASRSWSDFRPSCASRGGCAVLDVSKTMLLSEPVRDVEKTAEKQQKTRVLAQALRRGFALSKSSVVSAYNEVCTPNDG